MREPRVVLVTGASRGIGAWLTAHFAKRGDFVVGCSRGGESEESERVRHFQADVTDESQVRALLRFVQKTHGRLDISVNNAGVASMNPVLLTPGRSVDRIVNVNFRGTVLVSRESAKLMRKRRWGRIINLTSIAVPLHLEGEAIYAASKAAIEEFTRILARELAPFGITCNAVGPGPIKTDLLKGVPDAKMQELLRRLPISRYTTFEEVANVIEFFASRSSDAVTGQILYLGGA